MWGIMLTKPAAVGMNTFAFVEFRYAVDAANAAVTTVSCYPGPKFGLY